MQSSFILAHRGYWSNFSEKNTFTSLQKALSLGYGIETDVRDFNGQLVISHDPPLSTHSLTRLEDFLKFASSFPSSCIAFNIKSDGLASSLSKIVSQYQLLPNKYFFFDMSIPDMVSYLSLGLPCYARNSELEPFSINHSAITGHWVDTFDDTYPQVSAALKIIESGLCAAIVSPELHGKKHIQVWEQIKSNELHLSPSFRLCTDFPDQAFSFFNSHL